MNSLNFCESEESEVAQSCLTLCNPVDCSLPGSSIHGIFQARILERVAIFISRGSSRPRDQTWVSRIVGKATRDVTVFKHGSYIYVCVCVCVHGSLCCTLDTVRM